MRLLESNAGRPRRRAGMVVSVAVHTAVIWLGVVATLRGEPVVEEPLPEAIYRAPTMAPPQVAPRRASATTAATSTPSVSVPTIPTPSLTTIPDDIPVPGPALDPGVDPSQGLFGPAGPLTDVVGTGGTPGGLDAGAPRDAATVERQVVLVGAPPRPRYPEPLRVAGVEGRVVVRFVVDTTGRVERGSIVVAAAAHPLLAAAVEPLVPPLRFRPAEAGGHRVRQLVEMPFDFVLGAR